MDESTRLNKYLALQRGISRREADDFISHGRVKINGKIAELGARITEKDRIAVDDNVVDTHKTLMYLLLNKPEGYVCSRKQQGETPTIYQLIPKEFTHLKSVGRLDKDSSGLILLTNDGDFAHRMTHPSFRKTKTYEISLNTPLEPLHQQMITDYGIQLEDGTSKLMLERLGDERTSWRVSMHEGRNRQIRRTFAALGYTVTRLYRTRFGTFSLGALKPGESKQITP